MALIKQTFSDNNSLSGIWKITESEDSLRNLCNLTDYDKELLQNISNEHRRKEILAVRALLKCLNPELSITYNDRKPICNKGFISITHSDNFAAIIWHPSKKVAIDIEHINDRIKRIAKRAFNDKELEFAEGNTEILTTIWSCKECVFKLVDISGIDFKKQIFISDIDDNHNIKCKLLVGLKESHFYFHHKIIDNHILVWGSM